MGEPTSAYQYCMRVSQAGEHKLPLLLVTPYSHIMTVSRNDLLREQRARCFSFGPDLILHEQTLADAWPARPNVDAIKEEGLETLLLLNLDTLWPGYGFRLTNKTLNDWEGADIEAEDTARCRHVFEVKYGAPVGHVVDQALAYALGVLGRSTVRWFADQRTEDPPLQRTLLAS